MDRSAVDRDNNFRNTVVMVDDKLNTPANPASRMEPSPTITEVENFTISDKKPKDVDDFVNPDDVNVMKKMTIENRYNDNADAGVRSRKPATYAAKKTVAQGMMDIALLTSNANQLRNVVDYPIKTATVWVILTLIVVSLLLQVAVGVSLIFKGRFDSKGKDKAAAARVNKWMMSGVFVITIINIFIAVFSTSPPQQLSTPSPGPPPPSIINPAPAIGGS